MQSTMLQSNWQKIRRPYWQRRIRRHTLLALAGLGLTVGIYYALGVLTERAKVTMWTLSMASAYAALAFLGWTMLLGPWKVLRNRPIPVHTDFRRDVGIWAGILSLVHVAFGLQVHVGAQVWANFYPFPVQNGLWGFANYTGLGATVLIIVLLATSNNISLRFFGAKRWKALQRWTYYMFVLLVVHGIAYQFVEHRASIYFVLFGGLVLAVVIVQLAGFRTMRAKMRLRTDKHS